MSILSPNKTALVTADEQNLTGISTLLSHHTITPAAATVPVPVPPAATLVELRAQGGQVRVQSGGVALVAQGEAIEDGTSLFIDDLGPPLTVYAAVGVTCVLKSYYRPNTIRPVSAFDRFARWSGFTWPPALRTSQIGGKTWTVLNGTWTVSTSSTAIVQGVAPGSSADVNGMVVPLTAGNYGWFWTSLVLSTSGDAALIFRCDGTTANYNGVRLDQAAGTATVFRRLASVETTLGTPISGLTLPISTPMQLSCLIEANNACYVFLDGAYLDFASVSTTLSSNTYAGINTKTNGRFSSFGACSV